MTRYVAFLGGINVGGHRVTMDLLRDEFEALGHGEVSTFIASGNVIFDAAGRVGALEPTIEDRLATQLGYAVPTFVRTAAAVRAVVALRPFGSVSPPDNHFVAFLRAAPTAAAKRATEALTNDVDRFKVHGKELHWLVHGGLTDSSVKSSVLAKAVGQPSTVRNTKSLAKLADRL